MKTFIYKNILYVLFKMEFFDNIEPTLKKLSKTFKEFTNLEDPLIYDIYKTDKNYIICVDVPGILKEDIKLETINNETVEITCKRYKIDGRLIYPEIIQKTNDLFKYPHMGNKIYGQLKKRISIPKEADCNNIETKLENGVLYITIGLYCNENEIKRTINIQ
jgi:HSP20 family molecular chaperone IbpA